MAEIDRLDRLVRLARQEEPPPSSEADGEIMRRVRAASRPRPAAGAHGWRLAAVLAGTAAVAAVVLVLLIGRAHGPAVVPDGGAGVARVPAPIQEPGTAAAAETIVPALDILGGLENEVNQLMGSAEPARGPVIKT